MLCLLTGLLITYTLVLPSRFIQLHFPKTSAIFNGGMCKKKKIEKRDDSVYTLLSILFMKCGGPPYLGKSSATRSYKCMLGLFVFP